MSLSKVAKLKQIKKKPEFAEAIDLSNLWATSGNAVCIGRIVQVDADGIALVDFQGNRVGPVRARSVCVSPPKSYGESQCAVLLVFERGDPTLPIIVGIVRDTLFPSVGQGPEENADASNVQARILTWEAGEFLEFSCGSASITLTNDGRVQIRGREIISRSSRSNKIRGASVQIN